MTRKSKPRILNGFYQVALAFGCMVLSVAAVVFLIVGFPLKAQERYLSSLLSEDVEGI